MRMSKLLLIIYLLSTFQTVDIEENQHVAVYEYEVDGGYIYLDDEGYNVFIDKNTLEKIGATKEQTLLLTMHEVYKDEIKYIEILE